MTPDRSFIVAQLKPCGFRVASLPFEGRHGRWWFFATRVDTESGAKHWFCVDDSTVQRWTKNGGQRTDWTIPEAVSEFSPTLGDDLTWLDRLAVIGFEIRPADPHARFQNYYGSLQDGSRWLICESARKLIRYDVKPVEDWKLDGMKLVRCSIEADSAANVEQTPPPPQKTQPVRRSMMDRPFEPVEHSGRNRQEALF
jgi:hypothetical protein